jgi:hypothetical protein
VTSYKITQLEPSLKLEQVTMSISLHYHPQKHQYVLTKNTGAKCGTTYIDGKFRQWLNRLLGERFYRTLDPTNASQRIGNNSVEGMRMEEIMNVFETFKRKFACNASGMKMDLPVPLDLLNIDDKVVAGELTITKYASFAFQPFSYC